MEGREGKGREGRDKGKGEIKGGRERKKEKERKRERETYIPLLPQDEFE